MTDPAIDRAISQRPHEWNLVPDQDLVASMRRGEQRAFIEFVERFQPLLSDRARRLGARAEEHDEVVLETLSDVALALSDRARIVPRSFAGYLLVSLRNRIVDRSRRRKEDPHDFCDGSELDWLGAVATPPSHGADADVVAPLLSPALTRLANVIDATLSDAERQLLDWTAHHVTISEMAAWLGLPRGTVKVRLWRLRSRLRDLAHQHVTSCESAERRELLRFIMRSGAPGASDSAGETAPSTITNHDPALR